ncbi:hypothetical protein Q5P01_019736 [Channa striata]|uniref:Uncharacterized protein n=1 Tax=Channa striata TaxID=64152 RepID=A0AA88S7G6_CHASR|nr:hypothetical protein Q5P01_019736 [Channa striata]
MWSKPGSLWFRPVATTSGDCLIQFGNFLFLETASVSSVVPTHPNKAQLAFFPVEPLASSASQQSPLSQATGFVVTEPSFCLGDRPALVLTWRSSNQVKLATSTLRSPAGAL